MTAASTLARLLTVARKKTGLSIEDVAAVIEVDVAVLRRWENGESVPVGLAINRLADVLDLDGAALRKLAR